MVAFYDYFKRDILNVTCEPTAHFLYEYTAWKFIQANFDILLTVHLNIFILILTNLMH